jgi:hypothetical protein
VAVLARPTLAKDHPEFVIPATAGIHLDLVLFSDHLKIKSKMYPSFSWDDVAVFGRMTKKTNSTNNKPALRRVCLETGSPLSRG